METSRERILSAIDHTQPDTTPVHIMGFENTEQWLESVGATDDFDLRDKLGLDIRAAGAIYRGPNAERGLTVWGTEQDAGGYEGAGYSGVRSYPLAGATSVADIERFTWPDPNDFDYEIAAEVLRTVPERARCVRAAYALQGGLAREETTRGAGLRSSVRDSGWLPIACTLFELFGLEEALIMLHTEPKITEAAVAQIEAFVLEYARRLFEATQGEAELFWFGDDFSTQRSIMMSPEHWRRFFKPTYKKVFELAKGYGLKVWFHSCGTFRPVLDLIDIGMDVWETVQVHLPGNEPDVLKREFGQDIAFYGAINTQKTLPFGTPEDVRAEVRERIRVLGKGGGYICGSDHGILPDVPVANVLAMIDEARAFSA